jgi:short-subunit dehydrogenase
MPTALVTGASSGIGYDLAKVLANHRHDLILVARGRDAMQRLRDECVTHFGIKAEVIVKDLADPAAPRQIYDELTGKSIAVDILVNNAGFGSHGPFAKSDLDNELNIVQVNVMSLMQLTRLFLPAMIQRRAGRILNVASTAAYVPGPYMSTYYATKAFVLSHSVALARELRRTGVTVTALCPGPTHTGFQIRAKMTASDLFRVGAMSSMRVAEIGYAAMMKGKTIAIAGMHNRLGAIMSRLVPYTLLATIAGKLNGD